MNRAGTAVEKVVHYGPCLLDSGHIDEEMRFHELFDDSRPSHRGPQGQVWQDGIGDLLVDSGGMLLRDHYIAPPVLPDGVYC